ncbi:cytochrome o ubiquinol oxidase subunit IV [Candidatus Saccharibacteria bacterium]|nr:cytochrome o ubiquinol oxidase subunit IV [Candidatus Saccharibacteria bacterium]
MNDLEFNRLAIRYVFGFASALCLSVLGYFIIVDDWFNSSASAMAVLLVLAAIQLIVQLVCFLHLDGRGRSRGRAMTLGFTLLMMFVVVIGSLWIMENLDYRMGMNGQEMEEYMQKQNKKGF